MCTLAEGSGWLGGPLLAKPDAPWCWDGQSRQLVYLDLQFSLVLLAKRAACSFNLSSSMI